MMNKEWHSRPGSREKEKSADNKLDRQRAALTSWQIKTEQERG